MSHSAWPQDIYRVLKHARIGQVSYVPDAGHGKLIDLFHVDPEVQIARLALWDNRSEKLVQQNHPDHPWLTGHWPRGRGHCRPSAWPPTTFATTAPTWWWPAG